MSGARPRLSTLLVALALSACGDDAKSGGAGPAELDDTSETSDAELTDTAPADTALDLVDTAPTHDTAVDLGESAPDVADTASPPDTAPLADTTSPADTASPPDTAPQPDTAPDPTDPASCPVPSLQELYPGPLPPFPYGPWPRAEGCVAAPHDTAIVLGCPSNEDGTPSRCQIQRALIAADLHEAGLASRFIVSGAAVHNAYIEAHALRALLVAYGIADDAIVDEPRAEHTDENLYYSTLLMQERGWTSALVISEDPGHLMMTALCDSNCCVDRGRLTLYEWEVEPGRTVKAGHYALIPPSQPNLDPECTHITGQVMCINLGSRKACKDDFRL